MAKRRKTSALLPREHLELECKLAEEYARESFGLGVQCTQCAKWRVAFEWSDEREVPSDFECSMIMIDGQEGHCDIASELDENSDQFTTDEFLPGQVVWAKLQRNPWWPAIIKDDPEMGNYVRKNKGKKEFFVGFFDVQKTTMSSFRRASWRWVGKRNLKHFKEQDQTTTEKQASNRLEASIEDAQEALKVAETHRILWWIEKYLTVSEDENNTGIDTNMETETVGNSFINDVHEESSNSSNFSEGSEDIAPVLNILEESSHSSYFFERPEEIVPVSSAREKLRSDMELDITVLKNVQLIENKEPDDSTSFIQEESKVNFEDGRIYSFKLLF